jgi:hypothetical protein
MIQKKITTGWVTQVYDPEKKIWLFQDFTTGDTVEYEDERGNKIKPIDDYLPFDMVQPTTPKKRK